MIWRFGRNDVVHKLQHVPYNSKAKILSSFKILVSDTLLDFFPLDWIEITPIVLNTVWSSDLARGLIGNVTRPEGQFVLLSYQIGTTSWFHCLETPAQPSMVEMLEML